MPSEPDKPQAALACLPQAPISSLTGRPDPPRRRIWVVVANQRSAALVRFALQTFCAVAPGQNAFTDLVGRAQRAYADAREMHIAAKANVVETLVSPRYQDRSGVANRGSGPLEIRPGCFETRWPRTKSAPRLARNALIEWLGEDLSPMQEQRVRLAVSELVTNAVTHGTGVVTMRADLDQHRLRVEVIDQGPAFGGQAAQIRREHLSQLGLAIVEAITSRWGIGEGGTCVWFELERTDP